MYFINVVVYNDYILYGKLMYMHKTSHFFLLSRPLRASLEREEYLTVVAVQGESGKRDICCGRLPGGCSKSAPNPFLFRCLRGKGGYCDALCSDLTVLTRTFHLTQF